MEKLVDDGLVKHIGVSNFSTKQVEDLLEYARIKPVINQVELHPLLAQRKLVGVCARKVSRFVTAAEIVCGKQLNACSSTSLFVLELAVPSPACTMFTADAVGVCVQFTCVQGPVCVMPHCAGDEEVRPGLLFDEVCNSLMGICVPRRDTWCVEPLIRSTMDAEHPDASLV